MPKDKGAWAHGVGSSHISKVTHSSNFSHCSSICLPATLMTSLRWFSQSTSSCGKQCLPDHPRCKCMVGGSTKRKRMFLGWGFRDLCLELLFGLGGLLAFSSLVDSRWGLIVSSVVLLTLEHGILVEHAFARPPHLPGLGDVQGLVPCLLSSVPQDVPPKADLPLSRGLACHLSFADGKNWQQLTVELGTTHTHSLSRTMLRPM